MNPILAEYCIEAPLTGTGLTINVQIKIPLKCLTDKLQEGRKYQEISKHILFPFSNQEINTRNVTMHTQITVGLRDKTNDKVGL